jgi:hypothetical protein
MELWKLNNLFKIFLLSFVLAYLASVFVFHDLSVSQYFLVALVTGVVIYLIVGVLPQLKRKETELSASHKKTSFPRTTLVGVLVIILLFVGAFFLVRYETTPAPGYQLVGVEFLVLPNGDPHLIHPASPSNECAWLESMNATTQQKARNQGLPDCDFAWAHANLIRPTLFLEYENYTEFIYTIDNNASPAPSSTGTHVLCFTIPTQSYQCWVPPATVSHLR